MKIVGFDENSKALLVSFASDTTRSQDPTTYEAFAYQPMNMWPDVTDVTKIPQLIATAGMYQAQVQANNEALANNTTLINEYKAMVGQSYSFPISVLVQPSNTSNDTITTV